MGVLGLLPSLFLLFPTSSHSFPVPKNRVVGLTVTSALSSRSHFLSLPSSGPRISSRTQLNCAVQLFTVPSTLPVGTHVGHTVLTRPDKLQFVCMKLCDLSHIRQGPQTSPANLSSLSDRFHFSGPLSIYLHRLELSVGVLPESSSHFHIRRAPQTTPANLTTLSGTSL